MVRPIPRPSGGRAEGAGSRVGGPGRRGLAAPNPLIQKAVPAPRSGSRTTAGTGSVPGQSQTFGCHETMKQPVPSLLCGHRPSARAGRAGTRALCATCRCPRDRGKDRIRTANRGVSLARSGPLKWILAQIRPLVHGLSHAPLGLAADRTNSQSQYRGHRGTPRSRRSRCRCRTFCVSR